MFCALRQLPPKKKVRGSAGAAGDTCVAVAVAVCDDASASAEPRVGSDDMGNNDSCGAQLQSSPELAAKSPWNPHKRSTTRVSRTSKSTRDRRPARPRQERRPVFPCATCGKRFARRRYLRQHIQRVHGNARLGCEKCDKRFHTNHDRIKHCTPVDCGACSATFTCTGAAQKHYRQAHPGVSHECEVCGRRFISQGNLRRHALQHVARSMAAECEICGLRLSCKSSLRRHVAHHAVHARQFRGGVSVSQTPSRITKHFCQLCDEYFAQHTNLQRHCDRRHEGVMMHAYVCDGSIHHVAIRRLDDCDLIRPSDKDDHRHCWYHPDIIDYAKAGVGLRRHRVLSPVDFVVNIVRICWPSDASLRQELVGDAHLSALSGVWTIHRAPNFL